MTGTERYERNDRRLISPLPSAYTFTPLPQPPSTRSIVTVPLLPTVPLSGPKDHLTAFAERGEKETIPCYSLLLEHQNSDQVLLWDLGLRDDPQNSTKSIVENALTVYEPQSGTGALKKLKEGGYDVSKIDLVVLSHTHFDHIGDFNALPSPPPPILVGHGAMKKIGKGAPKDPGSAWPSTWVENYTIAELPATNAIFEGDAVSLSNPSGTSRKWEKVGCFDHGVDWFGDGSLWFIDTPGHVAGHLMALVRVTSDPPSYLLLAGDAAHHQTQYLPIPSSDGKDKRSPIPVVDGKPSLAEDPPALAHTIGQMTRMEAEDNVMVLMAHEKEAEGVLPIWPESLNGRYTAGWKREKDQTGII